jgi:hypothetical protein
VVILIRQDIVIIPEIIWDDNDYFGANSLSLAAIAASRSCTTLV